MFFKCEQKILISKTKNEIQTAWNSEQTVVEFIEYNNLQANVFKQMFYMVDII